MVNRPWFLTPYFVGPDTAREMLPTMMLSDMVDTAAFVALLAITSDGAQLCPSGLLLCTSQVVVGWRLSVFLDGALEP